MSWSYIPRWKCTDSCGRPRVPGGIHVGCTHDGHMPHGHATRRALLKAGVAIVGGAGLATVVGPHEVFAQVRVFPPPPPAVSPIAGLMDTHVHAAPDVFGRSLDDEEVATLYKDRGLESLVLKNHVVPTADRAWFARQQVAGPQGIGGVGPRCHGGWLGWRGGSHGCHPCSVRGCQHELRANEEGRVDGREARTLRDGSTDGTGGAFGVDAALAASESRGDCRRSEGSWRRKLHSRDRSRSDWQSEPGRRAATARH